METLDLWGIERILKRGGEPLNERSSLISYFSEHLERPPKTIAIRLAHYNLSLLYSLKSQYEDRLKKNEESARKWWWAITRTKEVINSCEELKSLR